MTGYGNRHIFDILKVEYLKYYDFLDTFLKVAYPRDTCFEIKL
jgi:hypothetical protein